MKKSMILVMILGLCGLIQAQTFTSITPKGGSLVQGAAYSIQWTYSGIPDGTLVKLVLFKDGTKLGNIIENIPIGGSGTGARAWTVGNYEGGTALAGTGYRIRIRDMDGKYPHLDSDPTFSITGMQQAVVRPGMSDRPPVLLKFPKLAVTDIGLVPYPDGTVNVIFGYKNIGDGPLPRRSEFAVQPDYRVVVDGHDLDKGDLFIPENPPAPAGWEVKTHAGGTLQFPTGSGGLKYEWWIGNMITVHINERKAGGMEPHSLTMNLKNLALKFGYDLLINGMEFDWATNTLKIHIRLDGKWNPDKSFLLIVNGSNTQQWHTNIHADRPLHVVEHKFDVWAQNYKISFDAYVFFIIEGNGPYLDIDQRNNNMKKSFDRPR